MSVCIQVNLICDFCNGQHDNSEWSIGLARVAAREDGWRKRKIDGQWLDICDQCQDQQDNAECEDALRKATQP